MTNESFYPFLLALISLSPASFCQDVKSPDEQTANQAYITFEQFGANGSGRDETANMQMAFKYAKQNKIAIRLMEGKTYVFSPTNTADLTGIPAIEGKGTIDVSKTGAAVGNRSMLAVFEIVGTKKLLQQNVTGFRKGQSTIQLKPGLDLKPNDVLFVATSEPLPNRKRDYYSKGQRLTVSQYNKSTGSLVTGEKFYYDMQRACIWVNDFIPSFRIGKEVSLVTSYMNFITGIRLYYAKGDISGQFRNFALTAIMFKSSSGSVQNARIEIPVNDNNGYSHGVEVADFSLVSIINCHMEGGRHVVSGGGGGLWKKEECNGSGNAGYPSELTVDGGVYKGSKNVNGIGADIGTLDSHGVIEKMTIKNCTVYGGINLGANYVTSQNVVIYADSKNAFSVGSDVKPDADWGHYTIRNVTIITDERNKNPLFASKANIMELKLDSVRVQGLKGQASLMDFRYNCPQSISVNRVDVKNNAAATKLIMVNKSSMVEIKNSNINDGNVKRMGY